ncbi:MAG: hypothetical protein FJY88_03190 [Candidatus Eisenbacteria bacterium]|nr:hypothetical protein [Candidatus Eisenbacteria bacterium]
MKRSVCILALVLSAIPIATPEAETLVVYPDGSGSYPTIQAAIAAANWGDIVELAYGRFTGDGNRDLHFYGKPITLRSQSGHAETCIIDCQGDENDPHRAIHFDWAEGPGSVVELLTIENGWFHDEGMPFPDCMGGGILVEDNAAPTIRGVRFLNCAATAGGGLGSWNASATVLGCHFEGCEACGGGGAYCFYASPTFRNCSFVRNTPHQGGGGISFHHATRAIVENCLFDGNQLVHGGMGGAVDASATPIEFTSCTFLNNSAYDGWDTYGGAIHLSSAAATVSGCTFAGNLAGSGGAIDCDAYGGTSTLTMDHTIIAFGLRGGAVHTEAGTGPVVLSCCDLYGNVGGDWTPNIAGQYGVDGNISQDPLFCDLTGGNVTLDMQSPCAPDQNPQCGQIGAWPVGCGTAAVDHLLAQRDIFCVVPNPTAGSCRLVAPAARARQIRSVVVLDVNGRRIRDLVSPSSARGGVEHLEWDARNASRRPVPSGTYLFKIESICGAVTARVIVVR